MFSHFQGVRSGSGKHNFKAIYEKSPRQFVYSIAEFDFLAKSVTNLQLPFPFNTHDGGLSFLELKLQLCGGLQTREGVIHLCYDEYSVIMQSARKKSDLKAKFAMELDPSLTPLIFL